MNPSKTLMAFAVSAVLGTAFATPARAEDASQAITTGNEVFYCKPTEFAKATADARQKKDGEAPLYSAKDAKAASHAVLVARWDEPGKLVNYAVRLNALSNGRFEKQVHPDPKATSAQPAAQFKRPPEITDNEIWSTVLNHGTLRTEAEKAFAAKVLQELKKDPKQYAKVLGGRADSLHRLFRQIGVLGSQNKGDVAKVAAALSANDGAALGQALGADGAARTGGTATPAPAPTGAAVQEEPGKGDGWIMMIPLLSSMMDSADKNPAFAKGAAGVREQVAERIAQYIFSKAAAKDYISAQVRQDKAALEESRKQVAASVKIWVDSKSKNPATRARPAASSAGASRSRPGRTSSGSTTASRTRSSTSSRSARTATSASGCRTTPR